VPEHHVPVSSFPPRATILGIPSASGRFNFSASSAEAISHVSISTGFVRITAEILIVTLLDGGIEGVHVDVDDLALAARGIRLVVVALDGHVVCPAGSSLTPRATILSDPSESGRCSFKTSSGGAVIQLSTSSGFVRITGIALGWMVPTSAFGSVVRNA